MFDRVLNVFDTYIMGQLNDLNYLTMILVDFLGFRFVVGVWGRVGGWGVVLLKLLPTPPKTR